MGCDLQVTEMGNVTWSCFYWAKWEFLVSRGDSVIGPPTSSLVKQTVPNRGGNSGGYDDDMI